MLLSAVRCFQAETSSTFRFKNAFVKGDGVLKALRCCAPIPSGQLSAMPC